MRGRSYQTQAEIGILSDINDPKAPPQWRELQAAGLATGLKVIAAEVRTPDDFDGAFQALASERLDVVIVLQTSMLVSERQKIARLAAATRLPTVYGYREHVVDGGLISYGVDLREVFSPFRSLRAKNLDRNSARRFAC